MSSISKRHSLSFSSMMATKAILALSGGTSLIQLVSGQTKVANQVEGHRCSRQTSASLGRCSIASTKSISMRTPSLRGGGLSSFNSKHTSALRRRLQTADKFRHQRTSTVRVSAAGAGAAASPAGEESGPPSMERVMAFQQAFWKFLRPHTIRGTLLGTTAVVARALLENSHAIDWALLPRALLGLLALLAGNGYIVGINQIYDCDLDKVNKPFLPIAAGELTPKAAWILCTALFVGGVGIVATNFGQLITSLYTLGLTLGTIYSVPPLRLKRFALPAPSIVFITCFVTVFATVIAITKDLADIEGDKKFKIETFATKLGVRTISFLGAGLLLANYAGAVLAAIQMPLAFRPYPMVVGHTLFGIALIYQTWLLDSKKYTTVAVASFYRFIWNLFYLEYILFPFI
eukprot:jgi/Mesen1/2607/ME000166S01730